MDQSQKWTDNKKEINRKMREFRTEMSEMSRLFQRAVMKGDEAQLAKLKLILKDLNVSLATLMDEIEEGESQR